MSNLRLLMISALLILATTCGAQSRPEASLDEAGDQSNGGTSAILVTVYVTPVEAAEVDFVTFTYEVVNGGTAGLCNITINNSISGVELIEPFDLKQGENTTRTAEYELTAEDRESSYLLNRVSATGYDCEDCLRAAAATAGCFIMLS